MYNLIMRSGDDWTKGIMMVPRDRFLLHTDKDLRERLGGPSRETIEELMRLPTLFMSEMPTDTPARIAWIRKVKDQESMLRIEFTPSEAILQLDPEQIEALLLELDIRKAEQGTTHWAVKDVDLFEVLQQNRLWRGFPVDPATASFSRRTIICACNLLQGHFTHARLTQFLQEIGMEHSPAAPNVGGMQGRMSALSGYAITFPEQKTLTGVPLPYAIIERAAELDYAAAERALDADREPPARREFLASLAKDGYAFVDGKLYAASAGPEPENRIIPAPAARSPQENVNMPMESKAASNSGTPDTTRLPARPKAFVVHGRDDGAKHEVARFLERIGLDAIILHEQPNGGRTLITKFQEVAGDVSFAVVLMTPDDVGGLAGETPRPRARQNVVFELGFFLGKMAAGRVCALVKGDLDRPSDFDGVAYIPLDANGGWKTQLMRELKHAGVPFNAEHALY